MFRQLVDKLLEKGVLSKEEFVRLISCENADDLEYLRNKAEMVRQKYYGKKIYIRGLIEFTSYCKNNCYYCGLRCENKNAQRYRLTQEQMLDCCKQGYDLGFRTFVIQGGEDNYFTDEKICNIVSQMKAQFPDCAITLSIGEKSKESYQRFFDAGADRYLLRHETADNEHYKKLHPENMSLENRKKCLYELKKIGYQVGCGFMVGSPFQTAENLADDMLFIHKLKPQMVGIGPFISQKDTPFKNEKSGTLGLTLKMLAIIRLMLPKVLLPSTTALGTINPKGRELGIKWGANVVMPNLSPKDVRKKYLLYDNKICTGDEAAECRLCMQNRMKSIGYEVVTDRGDCIDFDINKIN